MNKTTEQEFNELVQMINKHIDVLHIKNGKLIAEFKENGKWLVRVYGDIKDELI